MSTDELREKIQQLVESSFNTGRGFSLIPPPYDLEQEMVSEKAEEFYAAVADWLESPVVLAMLRVGEAAIQGPGWDKYAMKGIADLLREQSGADGAR